jgi:hypothetical protein
LTEIENYRRPVTIAGLSRFVPNRLCSTFLILGADHPSRFYLDQAVGIKVIRARI